MIEYWHDRCLEESLTKKEKSLLDQQREPFETGTIRTTILGGKVNRIEGADKEVYVIKVEPATSEPCAIT